jgi:hypothetical protein
MTAPTSTSCCLRNDPDGCPAKLLMRACNAVTPGPRPTDAIAEAALAVLEAAQASFAAYCATRSAADPELVHDASRAGLDAARAAVLAARCGVVEAADRQRRHGAIAMAGLL